MRLRSKSTGGWVGVVGAIHIACRSLNHTHITIKGGMTTTTYYMGVLYFYNVTFQLIVTAYIARIKGFNHINRIVIVYNNYLSCD